MPLGDYLFEMASLSPQETGLPFAVFVASRGTAQYDVRVKVTNPPWRTNPEAIYSLRPFALFEGEDWLSSTQQAALEQWVALNLDPLVDFWEERIFYDDDLRPKLHRV